MKSSTKKILSSTAGAAFLLAPLTLTGCGSNDTQETLTVATSLTWPPFGSQSPQGPVGIDVMIAERIAEELGKDLELIDGTFSGTLLSIQAGTADMAISAITITEERRSTMMFSDPYFVSGLVLLTNNPDSPFLHKTADEIITGLNGLNVGTSGQAGLMAIFAQEHGANVNFHDSTALMLTALNENAGGFEYGFVDNSVAEVMTANLPNIIVVDVPLTRGYYGIAVPLGDYETLTTVNQILAEIKQDGTLDSMLAQFNLTFDMGRVY